MLRIKQLREERGITQIHVANSLEVSRHTVKRWEDNEKFPDAQQLKRLADMFHVNVDDLYEDD